MNNNIRVIAEIGSNWRMGTDKDSLERAKRMIQKAAGAGAWGVKFQLFKMTGPNRLNLKEMPDKKNYELPMEWLPELKAVADNHRVQLIVTPFYVDAVEEIAPYVEYFKVASHDMTYIPLLEEVARMMERDRKSVFLSINGAYKFEELEATLAPFKSIIQERDLEVMPMYCTGGYPTPVSEVELSKISDLDANLMYLTRPVVLDVGFSVHIPPKYMHIAAATVLYRIETFEVHFDLDGEGVEKGHSYTPDDLRRFIDMTNQFKQAMTCGCRVTLGNQFALDNYRRHPSDWKRPFLRG